MNLVIAAIAAIAVIAAIAAFSAIAAIADRYNWEIQMLKSLQPSWA